MRKSMVFGTLLAASVPALAQAKTATPGTVKACFVLLAFLIVVGVVSSFRSMWKEAAERSKNLAARDEAQAAARAAVQKVSDRMRQEQDDPRQLAPRLEALLKMLCPSSQEQLKVAWQNYLSARLAVNFSYQTLCGGSFNPNDKRLFASFYESIVSWCSSLTVKIEKAAEAYRSFEELLTKQERRILYLEETIKELQAEAVQISGQLDGTVPAFVHDAMSKTMASLGVAGAVLGRDRGAAIILLQEVTEILYLVRTGTEAQRNSTEQLNKFVQDAVDFAESVRGQLAAFADCGDQARELFAVAEQDLAELQSEGRLSIRELVASDLRIHAAAALEAAKNQSPTPAETVA